MFLHAVESVLAMLIVIAAGFVLCGAPWFREHGPDIFSKFAVKVALPCYLFYNIRNTVGSREGLIAIVQALPVPALAIGLSLGAAALLAKLLKVAPTSRGVFINAIGLSNTVIAGFAVVEILLGTQALPDAMVHYVANTAWFWTLGVSVLRPHYAHTPKVGAVTRLKQLFSPALLALLLGGATVWFNLPLPTLVNYPIELIGRTASGLCMLFIGCVIRRCDLRQFRPDLQTVVILLGRFLLAPGLVLLICRLAPISSQMKLVFFLISVMPAMSQMSIMAKENGSDYEYASVVTTLTTIVSLVVIPLYMWLASSFEIFA